MGLHGNILKWIMSFLLDRKFEIGLAPSAIELTTKRGVPQGSVLRSILFNVLMATLPVAPRNIQAIVYADDITVLIAAKNYLFAEKIGQPYLDNLSEWATLLELGF